MIIVTKKKKNLEKILNVSRFVVLEKDKARLEGEQVEFMGTRFLQGQFLK